MDTNTGSLAAYKATERPMIVIARAIAMSMINIVVMIHIIVIVIVIIAISIAIAIAINSHSNSNSNSNSSSNKRWFGMRLDLLVFALSTTATISAACLVSVLGLSPGLTAAALTYIMQLAGLFQYVVRLSAELVNFMTSAERLVEFKATKPENDAGELAALGPAQGRVLEPPPWSPGPWSRPGAADGDAPPAAGTGAEVIGFEGVSFRWRAELPLVLRQVTFAVRRGEKCGVVGRTGAGKSTLAAALFRLAPVEEGAVRLCGVDVALLRLRSLRRALAVLQLEYKHSMI